MICVCAVVSAIPHLELRYAMRRALQLLLISACCLAGCQQNTECTDTPGIDVYFSPKGGCTEAVVAELDAAKATIFVQAYSFTSAPIAKALVDAHKRGVAVRVILDRSPADGEVFVGRFRRTRRNPHAYRRQTRHRPQQGHDYRRANGVDRLVQLHKASREQQRGKPAGDSRQGARRQVQGQLGPARRTLGGI